MIALVLIKMVHQGIRVEKKKNYESKTKIIVPLFLLFHFQTNKLMVLKQILLGGTLAAMMALTACKNDAPATETTPVTEPAPAPATDMSAPAENPGVNLSSPSSDANAPVSAPAGQGAPIQIQPATSTPPPASAPMGGSGKVNPPHGQPGHTCDLPVGAPLPG